MMELTGKYNTAKVFTYDIDSETTGQIIKILNQPFIKDSKVRMMPDVHAGSAATVGTTLTVTNKVAPGLIGTDIGCGMETILLKDENIDLSKLDSVIHDLIPAGRKTREKFHKFADEIDWETLRCIKKIYVGAAKRSMGTLGGGNHFIELDCGSDGKLYLIIHTGSRYFGKQIAEYYQKRAKEYYKDHQSELISLGLHKINIELAYLEGRLFDDYINDMALAQTFSVLNRQAIGGDIVKAMGLTVAEKFTTIHNYIDMEHMILRKGAISAQAGERVLIPMNMRDGSLLCMGKGNSDWNFSAPHGAGRLMSRRNIKDMISLEEYVESMKDIYSTTVNQSTLDESPFAYKPMEEIISNIGGTVDIVDILRPLYNFKSSE